MTKALTRLSDAQIRILRTLADARIRHPNACGSSAKALVRRSLARAVYVAGALAGYQITTAGLEELARHQHLTSRS